MGLASASTKRLNVQKIPVANPHPKLFYLFFSPFRLLQQASEVTLAAFFRVYLTFHATSMVWNGWYEQKVSNHWKPSKLLQQSNNDNNYRIHSNSSVLSANKTWHWCIMMGSKSDLKYMHFWYKNHRFHQFLCPKSLIMKGWVSIRAWVSIWMNTVDVLFLTSPTESHAATCTCILTNVPLPFHSVRRDWLHGMIFVSKQEPHTHVQNLRNL